MPGLGLCIARGLGSLTFGICNTTKLGKTPGS